MRARAGTGTGAEAGAEAGTIEAGGFSGDGAGDTKSQRAPKTGKICRNSVAGSGAMGIWVEVGGVALAMVPAVAEVYGADGGGRAIPGSDDDDDDNDDDDDEEEEEEDKVDLDAANF